MAEMAEVTVTVNGRPHKLTCDDGQEVRTRRLAEFVAARVAGFVAEVGQVGQTRLLLLAALVIADELSDANDALDAERGRSAAALAAAKAASEDAAGGALDLAQRIEAIAARLETA
jgi:cell division protein ZapA